MSIHFRADGSAHVIETMVVKAESAKYGVIRKKLPILFQWEIKNLKVSPDIFYAYESADDIHLSWSPEESKIDIPLEFEYYIQNGMDVLGSFPLVFYEYERRNKTTTDFALKITWDPTIQWQSFQIEQKEYNQEISDYSRYPLKLKPILNGIEVDSSSFRESYRYIIITAFPEVIPTNLSSKIELQKKGKFYHYVEKMSFFENSSIHHSTDLIFSENISTKKDITGVVFESNIYSDKTYDSIFGILHPNYQIIYNVSNIETSFWHLYSAGFKNELKQELDEGKPTYTYHFSYSKFGEHTYSSSERKQIKIRPVQFHSTEYNPGSFAFEFLFPEGMDLSKTDVKLSIIGCTYCPSIENGLQIPAQIGRDKNRIYLNWDHPFPKDYFPIILIDTDTKNFHYSYFGNYFASLNALYLSLGSGTNVGYILWNTIILGIPFFVLFIYIKKKRTELQKTKQRNELLEKIAVHDPQFNIKEFYQKTSQIAERIVLAWTDGNMESARHFISAGVFQRFQIQLKLLREIDQISNRMANFRVLKQEILGVNSFGEFLTIHMKLYCAAKDISVPISANQDMVDSLFRSTSEGNYEEVYSFSRKVSAKSESNKDLLHNVCPSCGGESPFQHITTKCRYCGSIFNSGESDWVLSEITQMIEWDPNRFHSEDSLQKTDFKSPTHFQIIEDRASALLWKWIYAKSKANPLFLKREVSNSKILQLAESKEIIFIPVVGSAEITKFEKVDSRYFAEVGFRWSAARAKNSLPEHRRTSIRLQLKETRDLKLGFGEASCNNCGAPYPEIDAVKCEYCNQTIPESVEDWLLEDIK